IGVTSILSGMIGTFTIVDFRGWVLPPDSVTSIGIPSLATLYNMSNTPKQNIISFDGQLQPDLKRMIERGDTQSILIRYAPDMLIVRDFERISIKDLTYSAWARLDYRPIEDLGAI